jgi:hypothetical protein
MLFNATVGYCDYHALQTIYVSIDPRIDAAFIVTGIAIGVLFAPYVERFNNWIELKIEEIF